MRFYFAILGIFILAAAGFAATVTLVNPVPGSTVNAPLSLTFRYDAGAGDPATAMCSAYFSGTEVTQKAQSDTGKDVTVGYPNITGSNTIVFICTGAGGFGYTSPSQSFTVNPSSMVSPTLSSSAPASGLSVTAGDIIQFKFTYDAHSYSNFYPSSSCSVIFSGATGRVTGVSAATGAPSGVETAISASVPAKTTSWAIVCDSPGNEPIFPLETSPSQITVTEPASVVLVAPKPGSIASSIPQQITFTYFAGANGPAFATCSAFLAGIEVTQKVPVSDGVPATAGYPAIPGANPVVFICTGAGNFGFTSPPQTFTVDKSAFKEVSLTATGPADNYVAAGQQPVNFRFTFDSGTNGKYYPNAICSVMFSNGTGWVVGSSSPITAPSGVPQTISSPVPSNAKFWTIYCRQATEQADPPFPLETPARRISVGPDNGSGGNGGSGGSGGSGGTGSGGSGGGSFAPRQSATQTKTTTTVPLAGTTATPATPEKPAPIPASLSIFSTGFVNDTVRLTLKDNQGRALSAVDLYIRVPGSPLSIKVTTDSLGRASFVPPVEGTYTYRIASGYSLSGSPSTTVMAKPPATAAAMVGGGGWLSSLIPIVLIIIGFAILIAVVYAGYRLLAPPKDDMM